MPDSPFAPGAILCTRCILPGSIPQIHFDAQGVCNYCREYDRTEGPRPVNYEEREARMIETLRRKPRSSTHHCLLMYSGGKDSTYILHKLVNVYGLRVLAFTFDNHFIPQETYENIHRVLSRVNADHVVVKPSWDVNLGFMGASFNNAHRLKTTRDIAFRLGHACWPCFVQLSVHACRIALDWKIRTLVVGTTPGQNRQLSPDMASRSPRASIYKTMIAPMVQLLKITRQQKALDIFKIGWLDCLRLFRLRTLSFFENYRYDENKVFEAVEQLGWRRTRTTDSCSTNCQLNALGIEVHRQRYGMSPYVIPLAREVREGLLSREEALEAVQGKLNDKLVQYMAERLGVRLQTAAAAPLTTPPSSS